MLKYSFLIKNKAEIGLLTLFQIKKEQKSGCYHFLNRKNDRNRIATIFQIEKMAEIGLLPFFKAKKWQKSGCYHFFKRNTFRNRFSDIFQTNVKKQTKYNFNNLI
jgi:hypothetical protein